MARRLNSYWQWQCTIDQSGQDQLRRFRLDTNISVGNELCGRAHPCAGTHRIAGRKNAAPSQLDYFAVVDSYR